MLVRILRTILGILLIPVAIGTGKAFYLSISTISIFSNSLQIIERGLLAYFLFHIFIFRPVYLYVLGHEFVHVLATWLCGGTVVSFHVTPSGGNVVTSKTNFFIELSPYFIPIYTIILGLAFWLAGAFSAISPRTSAIFLFLVGATLAFHFVMTNDALRLQQPDLIKSGMIFSLVVIFVLNLFIVMLVFCPIFESISFVAFIKGSVTASNEAYVSIYSNILTFVNNHRFW